MHGGLEGNFQGNDQIEDGYVYHNGYKLDETKSSYIASEECDSLWEVITSVEVEMQSRLV